MSNLRRNFPHVSRPSKVFNGYIRNLMQIGEYALLLFPEIWDLIFENTVVADVSITRIYVVIKYFSHILREKKGNLVQL